MIFTETSDITTDINHRLHLDGVEVNHGPECETCWNVVFIPADVSDADAYFTAHELVCVG